MENTTVTVPYDKEKGRLRQKCTRSPVKSVNKGAILRINCKQDKGSASITRRAPFTMPGSARH